MAEILHLEEKDFEKAKSEHKLILFDFFANWCGPCKMLAPVLERVQTKLGDSCQIAKINVDEAENLARQFRVMSIPTLILFKNGEIVEEPVLGLQDEDFILNMIKKHIDKD